MDKQFKCQIANFKKKLKKKKRDFILRYKVKFWTASTCAFLSCFLLYNYHLIYLWITVLGFFKSCLMLLLMCLTHLSLRFVRFSACTKKEKSRRPMRQINLKTFWCLNKKWIFLPFFMFLILFEVWMYKIS